MENPFKTSGRTSLPRQSENMRKKIHALYDDPIVIQPDTRPADESTEPADAGTNSLGFLLVGSIILVLCAWWLAPDWIGNIWKNLITQIFHSVRQ
jgi:hypothetical protein